MISRRIAMLTLLGIVALGMDLGCRKVTSLSVPLTYRPTDVMGTSGSAIDTTVAVSVEDTRDKKDDIGVNVEDEQPVRIHTADDPRVFVKDVLVRRLRGVGADVVNDAKSAKRVVKLNLNHFWSTESDTYKTEVQATVLVSDSGGKQLWKGVVSGGNSRFGRSIDIENYQETLSDATLQMVNNLISNSEFKAAMK